MLFTGNSNRFPEELNGAGCYGANILRVLAGSGYSLHWFPGGGGATGMYAQVTADQTTAVPASTSQIPSALAPSAPVPLEDAAQPAEPVEPGEHRRLAAARPVGDATVPVISKRCGCLYGDKAKRTEMIGKTNK